VNDERLTALLKDLDDDRRLGGDVGTRLCTACVDVLGVTGAGIMLMSDGEHRGTLGVSNGVMTIIEDLQFTLGEGPCIDASATQQPVLEPDLRTPAEHRWPGFSGPAVEAGVGAVFGFPLLGGSSNLGALDLYLDRPGMLRDNQLSDAVLLADVISTTVLALQADAEPGALADQLDASLEPRAVVHQASGMLAAQLQVAVDEALMRIRAHAYTTNRPVNEVACAIVDRHLRLT
jgi:hypothetical protein